MRNPLSAIVAAFHLLTHFWERAGVRWACEGTGWPT